MCDLNAAKYRTMFKLSYLKNTTNSIKYDKWNIFILQKELLSFSIKYRKSLLNIEIQRALFFSALISWKRSYSLLHVICCASRTCWFKTYFRISDKPSRHHLSHKLTYVACTAKCYEFCCEKHQSIIAERCN